MTIDAKAAQPAAAKAARPAAAKVQRAAPLAEIPDFTVPLGAILPFASDSGFDPNYWHVCDGTSLSAATYKGLFAVIGNRWGGDRTNFSLPDLRGYFLRGISAATGRDPDAATRSALKPGGARGNAVGSIQGHAFASHNHPVTDPGHTHTFAEPGGFGNAEASGREGLDDSGISGSSVTGISVGDEGAHETRPINAYVWFIIRIL
jgi:microcystin-dependent protein